MEFRTLKAEEIDVRVSMITEKWCTLLLYKDARVDQNILDETVGCMDWKNNYTRDNANCTVSIWDSEKKQWISKENTGTESFSEAEKGLASDSFKRACFNWGIGRELYTAPSIFVLPMKTMIKKGNDGEFYVNKKGKVETKTRFNVEYIDYDENRNIKDLIIRDNKGNLRFSELTKKTSDMMNKAILEMQDLIEKVEDKDEKFERMDFYKYFKVDVDSQLTYKQVLEANKLLKKKLEK